MVYDIQVCWQLASRIKTEPAAETNQFRPKFLTKSIFNSSTKISFCRGSAPPRGPQPPHYQRFMVILRLTTLGRTPLYERPTRHRDVTTHKTHKGRQTCLRRDSNPNLNNERPQTQALDRSATGISGSLVLSHRKHIAGPLPISVTNFGGKIIVVYGGNSAKCKIMICG